MSRLWRPARLLDTWTPSDDVVGRLVPALSGSTRPREGCQ